MRISFDLDDTLITTSHEWPVEPDRPDFCGRGERLRSGTIELFHWLREQNHEIWIYTNSYRGWKQLEQWFEDCGVGVDGVVNRVKHDQVQLAEDPNFRGEKNPAWFGIDLHVDDRDEMIELVESVGIAAVKIAPDDPDWVQKVKGAVGDLTG